MPVNVDNDIIKVTVSNSSQKNTVVVAPVIKYSGELITSLDQLTDVELTSLANNNELRYNDTSRKWENVPYVAHTPPPDNIGDLSDVANTLGTTGQVLAVNTAGDALEYVDVSSDNIATANLTQTGNRTLDNAGYTLSFANGSTPNLFIDGTTGNVGIGTTTPTSALQIESGDVLLTNGGAEKIKLGNDGKITVSNGSNEEIAINGTARNESIAIGTVSSTGQRSVSIGAGAGRFLGVNDTDNVFIGHSAGRLATSNTSVYVGKEAGEDSDGDQNVAIGYQALEATGSTASSTVAVGYQALTALTTGAGNTAVGYQAGDGITTAGYNTVVGYSADVGTSHSGTVMGYQASGTGSGVVAIGYQAQGGVVTNGFQNTGVGYQANYNGASEKNVSIGTKAGYGGTVRSVSVGHSAGYSGADYGVFIGFEAGYNETGSNKLYIENSNSTTPLIYGEFDNDIVRINGSLEVTEGITVDETGLASAGDYGKGSEVWYQGTGSTTAGSLYHLNSSGDWANTDASAESTAKGMLAFAAGTDSDVDGMVTKGFVYLGTDAGGSVGDVVYLSETANQATTTAPTTSGAIVRVLGYKVATNVIWFNPSNDWIELS